MAVFFLFSPLFADTGAESIDDAGGYLNQNVVTKKLANGITVILLNRGYSPTLSFETSFRVGSADESYRTMGAAHLLEHMLFKGTDTLGTRDFGKEKPLLDRIEAVGETLDNLRLRNPGNEMIPALEKELESLQKQGAELIVSSPYDMLYSENGGVDFNASTSRDKTGYYISLPAESLELWAKVESERLRNPVMREYYLERSNVEQERLMRYDSSGSGLFFEEFLAQALIAHPYRHPTIGWRSNIPFLSIKDVREFYRRYYIPSRMTITIVGRQNVDETFRVVEKYFSYIQAAPEPPAITVAEPKQSGEKRFVLNFDSSPYLIMGWHKPTYPSTDDYAFDMLTEILTGGQSGRLQRALVRERKLASSVETMNGMPGARYDNLFLIYAAPVEGHSLEELEKAIYEELEKALAGITEADMEKVRNRMESQMVFGLSANKEVASLLSYYQTIYGDWRYLVNYRKTLSRITIQDIRSAASKYCLQENRVVGYLKSSGKKEK
jgi:predicted Zn-dependent peptidase